MESNKHPGCLSCQKPLRGRTDKKFCNDYCRNIFHNRNKTLSSEKILRINRILIKNHQILQYFLIDNGIAYTKKDHLLEMGFSFRYFTHNKKNREGSVFRFCYSLGYLETEKGGVLLVGEEEVIY